MHNNNGQFRGKTALVTGASSGIGLATALAFGAQRAHVLVHYNQREAEARDAVARVCQAGGSGEVLQGDLSSMSGVRALTEAVAARPIDILVNNAGSLMRRTRVLEFTPELWEKVLTLNLTSAFFLSPRIA